MAEYPNPAKIQLVIPARTQILASPASVDRALMRDEAADDPGRAVGRLYDLHGAGLYRYALMILADAAAAEDAIQQVFASLLKHRGALRDEDRYLRRAVRNECYSALRRRAADRRRTDAAGAQAGPLLEPHAAEARPEERLALEAAIRQLPPDQREVLHLHAFEGRTFQEIADATDESINTVASRYRYALDRLRRVLQP